MTTTSSPLTVDSSTLQEWVSEHEDLLVIDVRSAAEFESLHIRGSFNVPLPLLSEHTDQLAERLGSRVVLACQSGVRAEQARQRLAATGLAGAYVLADGVPGYAAAGGDVVRGAERWAMDRQVRFAAGVLVLLGLVGGRVIGSPLRLLSGAIGAGLTFSAAVNSCPMASVLGRLPWNKAAVEPTATGAITQIPVRSAV
ncbi:rhodanese-like domain-containing protein [Rathayibacter sp. VKM Ac-2835]|uniref:rhodanese-like domain-containing protein n=1 Tax=Rathayibacter sp. VKM Ac-2835 TaxID=2739043 RepID=UPI001566F00F|nr:rhodanese-like domain-containing protein [Rathayibacter sp. VKM Ac-2835]NRG43114.1 rhodanese-like domain-containing protein [Rathayibacter sp. VKM Ac-2835]